MAGAVPPLKSALLWLHKWLGVALALLFLMWFVSGVVLYLVPFPNLGQAERLQSLPPLPVSGERLLTPDEAAGKSGADFAQARLGLHEGRPVWRLLVGKPAGWIAVDARDGEALTPLDAPAAARVAEAFSGRHAVAITALERDQWTVPQGLDPYRPLFKVALDSDDGLELYVSARSGEVVRDTRRAERFWNWVGAVPHWIYPTVLRQFPQAWNQTVVWLSIPGVVLALSGVALGVWQLFLNRSRWIPYRKFWMRWHHIAQGWVRADGEDGGTLLPALPDDAFLAVLGRMRPEAGAAVALTPLSAYDAQYYSRDANAPSARFTRPLPVWKASWRDGVDLYADAASGRMVLRVDASRRWQRVLYHGLHSFDFAPLIMRPWLRHSLVIGLSALGIALCLTSLVIAWRVLVRKRPRAI